MEQGSSAMPAYELAGATEMEINSFLSYATPSFLSDWTARNC